MYRPQPLGSLALGLSVCIILLFATRAPGQSCRDRTTLRPTDSHKSSPQQLAAERAEGDDEAAAPDTAGGAGEADSASRIEAELPAELEELLTTWEQKCSELQSLHGTFMRYVYDDVFNVEKRAHGSYWFEAPDQSRMDFFAPEIPDPPVNPDRIGADGQPNRVEAAENQKWIYTGDELFIIYEDLEVFDHIVIPPEQQGRDVTIGPLPFGLPFLFASWANRRQFFQLSLGDRHWPEGRTIERDGQQIQLPPQVHLVAYPKTGLGRQMWRRVEFLLDGTTLLPRALRLLDPTMGKETVYVFDATSMKVNDSSLLDPNPFDECPPQDFKLSVSLSLNELLSSKETLRRNLGLRLEYPAVDNSGN